jgi:hypothetical protein
MQIHRLNFRVNWKNFKVGASFFIPCLDTEHALVEVKKATKRLRYKIVSRVVIEKGIHGLRIWRLK